MTDPNIFRFYNYATIYSLAARIRQKHTHGFSVKIPASSSAAGARLGSILSRSVRKKNQNSFDVFVLGVQHLLGQHILLRKSADFMYLCAKIPNEDYKEGYFILLPENTQS